VHVLDALDVGFDDVPGGGLAGPDRAGEIGRRSFGQRLGGSKDGHGRRIYKAARAYCTGTAFSGGCQTGLAACVL
jgi:hypothetical protein